MYVRFLLPTSGRMKTFEVEPKPNSTRQYLSVYMVYLCI